MASASASDGDHLGEVPGQGTYDPTRVSAACAAGRHRRCQARVFVYPAESGRHWVPCECPIEDCGHHRDPRQ